MNNAGKESLTTLSEKLDLKGQRVFVRVDFNGACFVDMGLGYLVGWICRDGRTQMAAAATATASRIPLEGRRAAPHAPLA